MFGFGKQKALNELMGRMNNYVAVIQIATWESLQKILRDRHSEEEARNIAAAVANRLFGKPSAPMHASLDPVMLDEVAVEFLQKCDDEELRMGIIMSLRTLLTMAAGSHQSEAMEQIGQKLAWISTVIPLPEEAPDPAMMERLAMNLFKRYSNK